MNEKRLAGNVRNKTRVSQSSATSGKFGAAIRSGGLMSDGLVPYRCLARSFHLHSRGLDTDEFIKRSESDLKTETYHGLFKSFMLSNREPWQNVISGQKERQRFIEQWRPQSVLVCPEIIQFLQAAALGQFPKNWRKTIQY